MVLWRVLLDGCYCVGSVLFGCYAVASILRGFSKVLVGGYYSVIN